MTVLLLLLAVFIGKGMEAKASASDENINIIVPTTVGITFHEDGTTSATKLSIRNNSSVRLHVTSIRATEMNGWNLVSSDTEICVDMKQLSYRIDGTEILAGENDVSVQLDSMQAHDFIVDIKRGAWTYSFDEKAFSLEFEYEREKQLRTLTLDGGGYASNSTLQVLDATEVTLPTRSNSKYQFMGWADSKGKRYTDKFVMPREDTTLTALWDLPTYALHTMDDYTLTFVQSESVIQAGQTHHGKTITKVYSGFDNQVYSRPEDVPWLIDGTWMYVDRVVFEDPVFPESTAFWFFQHYYCNSVDVAKLYTHQVQDMNYMFYLCGGYREDAGVVITGLENWDTSQVNCMGEMFARTGIYSPSVDIGNIGVWDMSNVQDAHNMFESFGTRATEIYMGDLGMWKTDSLEYADEMFSEMGAQTKNLNIGNIGSWNVSKVHYFSNMFAGMGQYSETVYIGDLSGWEVGNSDNFQCMFQNTASYAKDFYVGDLSRWDISKADSTISMFNGAGQYSETFYLGDLSQWNVQNVSNMNSMFAYAGSMADWQLDLSSWNVMRVGYHYDFSLGVESKIIQPIWAK